MVFQLCPFRSMSMMASLCSASSGRPFMRPSALALAMPWTKPPLQVAAVLLALVEPKDFPPDAFLARLAVHHVHKIGIKQPSQCQNLPVREGLGSFPVLLPELLECRVSVTVTELRLGGVFCRKVDGGNPLPKVVDASVGMLPNGRQIDQQVQKLVANQWDRLVLRERIELSTSPLPRECSTTELPQPPMAGLLPYRTGKRKAKRNASVKAFAG